MKQPINSEPQQIATDAVPETKLPETPVSIEVSEPEVLDYESDPFDFYDEAGARQPMQVATTAPLRKLLQQYSKQTRDVVLDQSPESLERTATFLAESGLPLDPKAPLPKYAININLDNLEGPADVNRVIMNVAQALPDLAQSQRRGKQSHIMTKGKAMELLDENEGFVMNREVGEAMNAEQIMATRYLLIDSRDKVSSLALKIKQGDDSGEAMLQFRNALAKHSAIQMQLHGMAAEAGRALNAFRIVAKEQDLRNKEIEDAMLAQGGEKKMKELVDAYLSLGDNPAAQNKFAMESTRPGFADMVREYWYNFVLSGPKTHMANISGNVGTLLTAPVERGIAAKFGRMFEFLGGEAGVQRGEAAAMWSGYYRSMSDAWKLFNFSFRHNATIGEGTGYTMPLSVKEIYSTPMEQLPIKSGATKIEHREPAITGQNLGNLMPDFMKPDQLDGSGTLAKGAHYLGTLVDVGGGVLRTPSRLLGAEDQFFKTLGYRGQLDAMAVREARSLGLSGDELDEYVNRYVEMPPENAKVEAQEFADMITFTENMENMISRGFQSVGASPWGFLIAPFVRVTTNILDYSTMRTLAPMRPKWWKEVFSNDPATRDMALAKASVGAMMWMTAYQTTTRNWMCQDPDGICVTGSKPTDPALASIWMKNGMQEYSAKVDGKWYQYSRMDPAGQMLGMAADTVHLMSMLDEQDAAAFGTSLVNAVGNNVVNKNYMRSIAESMEVFTSYDPKMWKRYLQNKGTSFVIPNAMAQVAYAQDSNLKEAREFADRLGSKNPFYTGKVAYKRDLSGEKIPIEHLFGTHIRATDAKKDPVADELWRLQMKFRKPGKIMKGVELDPFQYDRYQELHGHALKMPKGELYIGPVVRNNEGKAAQVVVDLEGLGMWEAMDKLFKDPRYKWGTDDVDPPGQKAAMIKELQMKYREAAQTRIIAEYPEIKDLIIGKMFDKHKADGATDAEANIFTGNEVMELDQNINLINDYEVRSNDRIE